MVFFLYIVIGLAAGVLSGLFGIGGGILIIPALVLVMKMEPATATGTSLGALLLPVGALGAYAFWKRGQIDITGIGAARAGIVRGRVLRGAVESGAVAGKREEGVRGISGVVAGKMWIG